MKKTYPHLLQTPQWGNAKSKAHPTWKWYLFIKQKQDKGWERGLELTDISRIESSVLILERSLGFGQRLHYIPRGPYVDWQDKEKVTEVINFVKKFARQRSVTFVRFEPDVSKEDFNYRQIKVLGFKEVNEHVQPSDTVKFPIQKTDQQLLAMFHKKHRYNIKLAEKRGLKVRISVSPADVILFYNLLKKTEHRHGGVLHIHPLEYYEAIIRELAKNQMAKLYIVEKENRPISASLVVSYGSQAIYMFGASDYEYRRDMPNHLREWQSIKDARAAGIEYFDLWGATMRNDPGLGIKRYKLGYFDKIELFAGTFDWSPAPYKYVIFTLLNKLRRNLGF
jgi:peptidoglycan pentaglycine glycine transferase (the first glycine)